MTQVEIGLASPTIAPISPCHESSTIAFPVVAPSSSSISLLSLCPSESSERVPQNTSKLTPRRSFRSPMGQQQQYSPRAGLAIVAHPKVPESPNLSPVSGVSSPTSLKLASPSSARSTSVSPPKAAASDARAAGSPTKASLHVLASANPGLKSTAAARLNPGGTPLETSEPASV